MLASWHDARLDQKHLFTLLMNQLYVTHVPGLQGRKGRCGEGRREKRGVWICWRFGLPMGAWPSATATAPVSLRDDSYTTCQDCMSVSIQIKQKKHTKLHFHSCTASQFAVKWGKSHWVCSKSCHKNITNVTVLLSTSSSMKKYRLLPH